MPLTWRDGSVAGTCSVCGEPAWSIRSNKCELHKVTPAVKIKAQKPKKGEPAPRVNPDGSARPVVTQIVETAGAIDSKTFSGKPPTPAEWEDKLTALVVLATMTYVEYVVVKPFHLPEEDATRAVAVLGMTDDEARTIVEPCSFLLSKSSVNKKYGREALEMLAFAPAILAIIAWADRVQSFKSQMLAAQQGATPINYNQGGSDVSSQGNGAAQGPGPTGPGPAVVNFSGVTDPSQAPTARVDRNGPHMV